MDTQSRKVCVFAVVALVLTSGTAGLSLASTQTVQELATASQETRDPAVQNQLDQDEFEPNDDFASATPVTSGTYENLSIGENDLDVFAVELTGSERLSAAVDFDTSAADIDLLLIGPNRTGFLDASVSETAVENVSHVAPEDGTYYLVVYGYGNSTGPYDLTVSVDGADAGRTDTGDDRNATRPENQSDDVAAGGTPDDPEEDVIGWEAGYWANETIDIDQSDGLSDGELDAYLARSMARVEEIRGLEFTRSVDVTVVSRDELASGTGTDVSDRLAWSGYFNQIFEASFLVDEETDAYEEFFAEQSATVGGYYVDDQIVIVAENASEPVIDEGVLIHELTHAAQDQHFELAPDVRTFDEYRGYLGLVEGDANYVTYEYRDRCSGEWQCVETPGAVDQVVDDEAYNLGISLVGHQPYSDGPALVSELVNRSDGNWDAVNAAYEDYPESTEEVIHPERYPDEQLAPIEDPAGTNGEWELFGVERIGEAWLYTMFVYQAVQYGNDIVDRTTFADPDAGRYDQYNYTSALSEGWGNDQLRLYTDGTEYGYAWTLVWDSEADAQQFVGAYEQLLDGQGGEPQGDGTWVIPESEPYADAFHIDRDGTTVTIVNAPDVATLSEVAPDVVDGNGTEGANAAATPRLAPPASTG